MALALSFISIVWGVAVGVVMVGGGYGGYGHYGGGGDGGGGSTG